MAGEVDLRTTPAAVFQPHVGSLFTFVSEETRRELRLDRVEEKPHLMEGAVNPDGSPFYQRAPFALVFSGPRDELSGQASFEVRHAALGSMILFVKPFGEQGDTVYYEALVS